MHNEAIKTSLDCSQIRYNLMETLNRTCGYAFICAEKEEKDFSNENVKKMRQVQALNRRRKKEEELGKQKPVKVLPQSEKYREVPSKVTEKLKVCFLIFYLFP